MATVKHQRGLAEARELCDRYVKPLEAEHQGEYAAVLPDGRLVLEPTFIHVAKRALRERGTGSHIYKVGDVVAGGWR